MLRCLEGRIRRVVSQFKKSKQPKSFNDDIPSYVLFLFHKVYLRSICVVRACFSSTRRGLSSCLCSRPAQWCRAGAPSASPASAASAAPTCPPSRRTPGTGAPPCMPSTEREQFKIMPPSLTVFLCADKKEEPCFRGTRN